MDLPAYLSDQHTFEQRIAPPPTAYGRSATGYGSRIPTDYQVRVDYRGPWRRVYAICWSNAASLWVSVKGQRFYFRDCDLLR